MAKITDRCYESNLDHLLAELSLLDLRLSREIQRVRHHYGELREEFRGLLVSEEQIDSILSAWPVDNGDHDSGPDPFLPIIQQRERDIADTCLESRGKGVSLRLERLRELYNLDPWDTGVMILCLAPELDLKYEALYSYLQDDVGKKQPTVNLALNLLCDALADRVAKRKYFLHLSPLAKHDLVHIAEEPHGKGSPFLARSLKLDPPVVEYLLGSEALDSRLQPLAHLMWPETSWDEVVLPAQTKARLAALVEELQEHFEDRKGTVLQLVGPEGTGKKTVAQALCHSLGRPLLVIDSEAIPSSELPLASLVNPVFRDALLHDAVLCWDNFHLLLGDEPQQRAAQALLGQALVEHPGLTILAGHTPWRPQRGLEDRILLTVELPLPEYSDRKHLWENHVGGHRGQLKDEEFGLLASKFRFSGGQVRQVAATARGLALWRSGRDGGHIWSGGFRGKEILNGAQTSRIIGQEAPWQEANIPRPGPIFRGSARPGHSSPDP